MIVITILLFMICGAIYAASDVIKDDYEESIFKKIKKPSWLWKFIDPSYSIKYKYIDGKKENGNRFFLSDSIFSFVTNASDFLNLIGLIIMLTGVAVYKPAIGFIWDQMIMFGLIVSTYYFCELWLFKSKK